MKRTLTLLLVACLLPALSVRAQESLNDAIMQLSETVRAISAKGGFPSPGSLTDEEWARIEEKALFRTETVSRAADTFVDTTLKVNGVADGKVSYSRVVELMLRYESLLQGWE